MRRLRSTAARGTRLSSCALLLLLVATPVVAQETSYRERSDGQVTLQTPGGPMDLQSEHEATIAIQVVGTDSLHAWYTSLDVRATDPAGAEDRPDPSTVLGERFVLRVGPTGHLETLATPEFPETFAAVTDLTLQFFDFFPSRPQGGYVDHALWTDTTYAPQGADPATVTTGTKISEYRIVGRSEADGIPVFEIRAEVELAFTSEGPVPEQPGLSAHTSMEGRESNVFLVSVSDGSLVHRRRTGELSGQIEYVGAPQPIVLPIVRRYESVIERLNHGGGDG